MRSLIPFLVLLSFYQVIAYERVKLKDVQALTFYEGRYTIGRKPIPQLSCRSRLCGKHQPAVVQCQNVGFDGMDYQWKCNANLDKNVKFGKLAVNCEGYDYPNDPYIIAGSCGLEFELAHKSNGPSEPSVDSESSWPFWIFVGVVLIFLMITFCSSGDSRDGRAYRSADPSAPPPPGFRSSYGAPPPEYSEYPKQQSTYTQQPADSGLGGFWTGLGLGGLGGYMFGRNNSSTYTSPPTYPDYGYYRPSTQSSSYQNDCYSSGSSGTYQAEGFGGTKRR